jgi:hypothetical protein
MNNQTWGMRFNPRPEYKRFSKSEQGTDYPDWFEQREFDTLQEQGLIAWNNIDKKIHALNGHNTLRLLEQLESHDNWKTEEISVTMQVTEISLQTPPRGKRKKTETPIEPDSNQFRTYDKEMVHLPPEAGTELIDLINQNKSIITDMAERETKQVNDAMLQLYKSILESERKGQMRKFDFSNRQFQWASNDPNRWTCYNLQSEGHVCLRETKYHWCACIKRQQKHEKTKYFNKFADAIEWVEMELLNLADHPDTETKPSLFHDKETRRVNRLRLRDKLRNSQFWIDPSVMEPSRKSYKVFLELEAAPTTFETIKITCGDTIRVNERFPGLSKLATSLNLDRFQFDFQQPLGDWSSWYLITSLTTFYQETSAADQSQILWNQSRITQAFKEKTIRRARYGFQEVETGFHIYLGACESSEDPWWVPETRDEHMESLALRESICYSLDVADFRDFLGFSTVEVKDQELLETMHETRARSKYLAEEIKRESKIWLAQHSSK